MLRRLPGLLLLLALGGGVASCFAPTVPIPPPEPELMTFEVDALGGTASFTYQRDADYAGAVVYVFDRDSGQGIITTADADGAVGPTAPFAAQPDDEVVVSFELSSQLVSTCVRLRDGPSNSNLECGL